MTQEILDAVKKSLPTFQVEALKAELAKADKLESVEKQLAETKTLAEERRKNIEQLNSMIQDFNGKVKTSDALEKERRDIDNMKLKYELECEKQKTQIIKDLAYAAFRNPIYMKSYQVPVQNMGHTVNVTETNTQD